VLTRQRADRSAGERAESAAGSGRACRGDGRSSDRAAWATRHGTGSRAHRTADQGSGRDVAGGSAAGCGTGAETERGDGDEQVAAQVAGWVRDVVIGFAGLVGECDDLPFGSRCWI
jgi:hypothetical protein